MTAFYRSHFSHCELPGVFAGDVSFEVKLCCDEVDSAPSVFLEVCSPFFGAGNRLEIHVLESLECYKKITEKQMNKAKHAK